MIATLISEENKTNLSGLVPEEVLLDADILIGAYDPATMSVAGVLTAEVLDEKRLGITWIYVVEGQRRKGAAREMLGVLAETVLEINAPDFIVCSYFKQEEEDIYRLLLDCGFIEDRLMHAEILAVQLGDCAVSKGDFPGRIVPLSKISQAMWDELSRRQRTGVVRVGLKLARSMVDREFYDAALSVVALDEEVEPVGELLVSREEQFLWIHSLFSMEKDSAKVLRALVSTTIAIAKQSLSGHTVIQVLDSVPQVEKLMKGISANRAIKMGELMTQMSDARMIVEAVRAKDPYRFVFD